MSHNPIIIKLMVRTSSSFSKHVFIKDFPMEFLITSQLYCFSKMTKAVFYNCS